jgi:hypothetical protein
MGCRSEPELERAAARLLLEGAGPSADLEATLDHARGCARCGEVLEIFLEARTLLGEERDRPGIVLPLRRWGRTSKERARPWGKDTGTGEADAAPEFEVAAATVFPGRADAAHPAAQAFECSDERFLIRIVPDEAGTGASAILVALLPDWSAAVAAIGPRLRVGASEYPFGPDAVAHLPEIPSGPLSLVLAQPEGPAAGA